jgi:AcrR family transcriptional regulator
MAGPRTSTAIRREAVARAFGDGGVGVERVAQELGVDPSTLYRWARRDNEAPDAGERLVAACQELLATRTYGELSVQDVARAAGVAPRTAFNRFPTKEALFAAAVHDAGQRMLDAMTAEVDRPPIR